ncbi:MAG: hypothetical protein IJZ55_11200 [Lachnospiraceae bacterium]|nr:hypothetical protein [Lachnospiraceae bacterium]
MIEEEAAETTWEQYSSVFRTMFPIVSTKTALQDTHFTKGFAHSCQIYAIETKERWASMKQHLEQALEEYRKSYEESGTLESVANLLWALCLGYACSVDGEAVRGENTEYTKNCYETGMLLIGILRETKVYEELAEYYFALLYYIGMVGNGMGIEHNKAVGVELMKSLVIFGNPYTVCFVKECELIG